jgi:hypothetical protein
MTKMYGSEEQEFEPASIDVHNAVCCEFVDLGERDGGYGVKHQGMLVFQVEEVSDVGDRKEVRFYFTMTLGSDSYPSKFRLQAEKWRGKKFTDDEVREGFDPEVMVGVPCRLSTNQKENKDKTRVYAVIDSILPVSDVKLKPLNYRSVAEREAERGANRNGGESAALPPEDDDIPF